MADPTSTTTVRVPDPTDGPGPRRVLVTGADSGIGKACAVALADDAEHVAITWHADEDGARRAADEIAQHGATAHVLHLDLTDPTSAVGVVDDEIVADDLDRVRRPRRHQRQNEEQREDEPADHRVTQG